MPIKTLCVYCGASLGASPAYTDAARALARAMADNGITLVYGGARIGLMGVIADEVMRHGGRSIGVIPRALLELEVGHDGLTQLHVVKDMHERKALMAELSDGFIAMPGGIGTLEELFEALTWSQLGLHHKPLGLLNVDGFYAGLLAYLEHVARERFVGREDVARLIHESSPAALLARLMAAAAR